MSVEYQLQYLSEYGGWYDAAPPLTGKSEVERRIRLKLEEYVGSRPTRRVVKVTRTVLKVETSVHVFEETK